MPPSVIWFQLQLGYGKPYDRTKASTVSPSDDTFFFVSQFLDGVKHKFADSYLSGVASVDLDVYANDATYAANGDPLDVEYVLNDSPFGQCKADALIVVAPPTQSASSTHRQYVLPRKQQQLGFDTELDVTCCKLSTEFLIEAGLNSYRDASVFCSKNNEFKKLLKDLEGYDTIANGPCRFTCIIAPSGTGKTQLAATAVAANKNVVYFYTGSADGCEQAFYKPHVPLTVELLNHARNLQEIILKTNGSIRGADFLLQSYQHEPHPIFRLLYKCIFQKDSINVFPVTIQCLRSRIINEKEKLLVFLDEVPPETDVEAFMTVIFLRDIIRAVGVSPILMSTHSGSINAIASGSDSRRDDANLQWCRIVVYLPEYQADDNVFIGNPWLKQSERPLVATMMVNLAEKHNLSIIVKEVQNKLQDQKPMAWLDTPGMQLCQLFRTTADYISADYKHRVVGFHFGKIHLEEDPCEITRKDTMRWMNKRRVEFVNPEKEPILFLALTTWKLAQVEEVSLEYFPLVSQVWIGNDWNVKSVRQAYNLASDFFDERVTYESANRLDGMEMMAFASVTLASLQSDNGIFHPIKLPRFLSNVFHFMCEDDLNVRNMDKTTDKIKELLEYTPFSAINIPACPVANSCMRNVWPGDTIASMSGQVKWTTESERRDGVLMLGTDEILHIECKNYTCGISSQVVKDVVHQMRPLCNMSIIFASGSANIFAVPAGFYQLTKNLCVDINTICFLVLEPKKHPAWLKVENGIVFECKENSEKLVVLVCTGAIGVAEKR